MSISCWHANDGDGVGPETVESTFGEQPFSMCIRFGEVGVDTPAKLSRANFIGAIQDAALRRQMSAMDPAAAYHLWFYALLSGE